jgi:hypothetical protein
MTRTVKIQLCWSADARSNHPKRAQRFSLPARFDHQDDDWTSDAWSLVIELTGLPDAQGYQTADAKFLVPNAPHSWLSEGKKFVLFDGNRELAAGEVQQVISP